MKQKINIRIIGISILAILVTMLSVSFVYYQFFQEQIRNDLMIEARLIAESGMDGLVDDQWFIEEDEVRITWISNDGKVLYDNDISADDLGNHQDRPEVRDALKKGWGESIRTSDTMKMMTYYYALLLEDGTIVRVATDARSYLSIFMSAFPVVAMIILLIIGLCIVISHFLTAQLLEPIRRMAENMDEIQAETAYKELSPFINRIREQHDDILASARARQEFTANVSHELKTPITAISGYAELIENQMVDQKMQVKFAGDIRKNADRLVSLVNDILRLSELDQSSIAPEMTRVDLYEVARERVELLQNTARQKQLSLFLKGKHCVVTSNRGMMTELLDNLIQNAIRYNVPGGIVIVEVEKVENKGILSVADTGIGIPEADQSRVFERFYRVDKSRSRDTGGTGLGLSIVKHIVELHEGRLELKSEPGKGTTFTVIL